MGCKERQRRPGRWPAGISCGLVLFALLSAGFAGEPTDSQQSALLEQALAAVRNCMARTPAPWPQEWQQEYIDAICKAIGSPHEDDPQYVRRLEILREGFGACWAGLAKDNKERSHFDVCRTQIRWYVERLMAVELPNDEERQTLRRQYEDLANHAAASLIAQFSFLDPNAVQKAKMDYLADCHRNIDAPLLPIFLKPFTQDQIDQIRQRWHDQRYTRIDLWQQLAKTPKTSGENEAETLVRMHRDYLLTRRSLGMLHAGIQAIAAPAPEYFQSSVANALNVQRQRFLARFEARRHEMRLSTAAVQTEHLSFLLATLLETATSKPSTDSGGATQSSSENRALKGGDSP